MSKNSNEEKEQEGQVGGSAPQVETPDWESIARYKAAELENYIKRTKDSVQTAFNDGKAHVMMMILPLTDSLTEALKTVKADADRKGIEILARKFDGILKGLGLEEIPVKAGDQFDPFIHQSINQASEGAKNKIVEVYTKGYKFAGKTIRPATVRI